MLGCRLVVCAESVVRDALTDSISVFNILEEINAQTFPLEIPKLSCLFLLTRGSADDRVHEGFIRILDSAIEIISVPVTIDFDDEYRNRHIVAIGGVRVLRPGELKIELRVLGQAIGEWTIPVRQVGGTQVEEVSDQKGRL